MLGLASGGLAAAACLALAPTLASAQAYPSRAIKIIVPAPPGGAIDLIARVVGDGETFERAPFTGPFEKVNPKKKKG